MEKPDGVGKKTGDCGDTVTIYLAVKNGIVDQLTFELEGCINTNACANALAVLVEGKPVEDCWNVTPTDVIDFLQTLPEDHHHCAELAVGTLYLALADWAKDCSGTALVGSVYGFGRVEVLFEYPALAVRHFYNILGKVIIEIFFGRSSRAGVAGEKHLGHFHDN